MIGVVSVGARHRLTTLYLQRRDRIGSQALPAPQATLMSTIIKGLLDQNLPWGSCSSACSSRSRSSSAASTPFVRGRLVPADCDDAPIFVGGLVALATSSARRASSRSRRSGRHALQLEKDHPLRSPADPRSPAHPARGRPHSARNPCTAGRDDRRHPQPSDVLPRGKPSSHRGELSGPEVQPPVLTTATAMRLLMRETPARCGHLRRARRGGRSGPPHTGRSAIVGRGPSAVRGRSDGPLAPPGRGRADSCDRG